MIRVRNVVMGYYEQSWPAPLMHACREADADGLALAWVVAPDEHTRVAVFVEPHVPPLALSEPVALELKVQGE